MRHETMVISRDMDRWEKRCRATLFVDFHAPGMCEDTGVYAHVGDPEGMEEGERQRQEAWTGAAQECLGPYAAANFVRVPTYHARSAWGQFPSASQAARKRAGVLGVTLETSYVAAGETVLTLDRYREIGERLAKCCCS